MFSNKCFLVMDLQNTLSHQMVVGSFLVNFCIICDYQSLLFYYLNSFKLKFSKLFPLFNEPASNVYAVHDNLEVTCITA